MCNGKERGNKQDWSDWIDMAYLTDGMIETVILVAEGICKRRPLTSKYGQGSSLTSIIDCVGVSALTS
jgi:hypothetical protein